ncbi:hypothetical protein F8M41_013829 [Gigaspora margarita]|uniref:BED-type domain-containing protein n=1 Tax=Gigaspora margarita TaxID=4874 RepID=A0A8H3WT52_GIGMA|nr:hypothetical protein F8M41_017138 [Gigaspora margarita]KAF0365653.1 hypothetical protein F8M41_013829 [Gigaspora margarita]
MRNTHEIRNYFHNNTLKTCLICNIYEANYPIDTNLTNLKNHFAKYHKQEFHLAMTKNEEKRKQIKKINYIQRRENEKTKDKNSLATQNNEISIIQIPKPIQIENFNKNDYITEEETIEVSEIGQTLPLIHTKKKKTYEEEQNIKKQKEKNINIIDNIELTKNCQINIIKDVISISGKCKIFFK